VAQEGERDVQVLARDDAELARELSGLPRLDLVECVDGKPQREEKA
jgi:hypothetical protein